MGLALKLCPSPWPLRTMQYVFTLTPQPPSKAAARKSPALGAPTYTFHSLPSGTAFKAAITCTTPKGQRVQSSKDTPLATPSLK